MSTGDKKEEEREEDRSERDRLYSFLSCFVTYLLIPALSVVSFLGTDDETLLKVQS